MSTRRAALVLLVVAGLVPVRLASTPQSQSAPPQKPSGVVLGKVVDGPGGTGVPEAMVRIRPRQGGAMSSVWTDALGQFVFFNLADGTYDLEASKPGFFAGTYGQRAPQERGRDFVMSGGRAPAPVAIPIWKGGEITGRVTDEHGEPIAGWPVQLLSDFARGGRVRWIPQTSRVVTDDRGAYRISDIYPGDYLLVLRPVMPALEVNGELRACAPLIHPTASVASGGIPLTIAVRDERAGIDFTVRAAEARSVQGRVTGAATVAGLTVRLSIWDEDVEPELDVALTTTSRTGEFGFLAVPQGSYRISVWNAGAREPGFAMADDYGVMIARSPSVPSRPPDGSARVIVADADLTAVAIELPRMVEIAGRFVYRGATQPTPQIMRAVAAVTSTPSGASVGYQQSDESGSFRIAVPPGTYFVRPATLPPGWALEAITAAGRSAFDAPIVVDDAGVTDLVIALTDQIAEVTGTVRGTDGGSLPIDQEATVLMFPTDQARWLDFGAAPPRIRTARVAPTGAFTVRGLPPGDYFFVAKLSTDVGADWQLATNFARLSRLASRVQVTTTVKASADLRVSPGR